MVLKKFLALFTRSVHLPSVSVSGPLLAPERLQEVLVRERLRSDRNGSPFCLLIVSGQVTPFSEAELGRLASQFLHRLRFTDEMGILQDEESRIGLVLPETSAIGAWKLADDLRALCCPDFPPLAFDVYAYPSFRRQDDTLDNDEDAPALDRPVHSLESTFQQPLPAWKRGLDVLGAIGGLICVTPIILVAGLAVRMTSPGPIFFTQRRDGRGGRPFNIYKIRTMRVGADAEKALLRSQSEQDGPAFKMTNDPRVTAVGAFLRKTSIDELPQLLNVLRGDVTLVGPRPLPCDESQACESWQRRRLDVTPGITCIWQVYGRSRVTFAEWVRMDLTYVAKRSLWQDLKLLLATVPTVLLRRGAK